MKISCIHDANLYNLFFDRPYVSIQHRNTFESAEGYYASLFHEFAHSTGHEKRLKRFNSRDVPRPFASDEYSKEELVAELGSAFLCVEAGIDNSQIENSAAYIQGWLKPPDYPQVPTYCNIRLLKTRAK